MKVGVAYFICLVLFFTAMYGVARLMDNNKVQKLEAPITSESGIKFSDDCKYYVVGSSQGTKYLIKCGNKAEAFLAPELTKQEIQEFEKRYNNIILSGDLH